MTAVTDTVMIHGLAHGQRVWHPLWREEGTVFHTRVITSGVSAGDRRDAYALARVEWTDGMVWPLTETVASDLVELGPDLPRGPRR